MLGECVGEISVRTAEDAYHILGVLLNGENDYCVMLSREEDLWIINYVYAHNSDRNKVVFMDRDEYESRCDDCVKVRKIEDAYLRNTSDCSVYYPLGNIVCETEAEDSEGRNQSV